MEQKTRFSELLRGYAIVYNHRSGGKPLEMKGEGEFSVPLLPITQNLFQNVLEAASQNAERKFRRPEPSV